MKKRILISGGGIAGMTAARLLFNQGHEVTVIDKARKDVAIQCYLRITDDLASKHARVPQLLKETFRDYKADVQHLIDSFLKSGLMFADKMGMVHAPALTNGKLVLLGDAGYCPTALSGMGASLSIYGAKALAHFMKKSPDDLAGAIQRYDSLMQPISESFGTMREIMPNHLYRTTKSN
ncbi:NAD(P)-binding protein [Arcticibacter sp. MXS-1]|uniref:FAD-dependent oxidoreductase n=1 Tax=Arcticibacter sp. MXS-1 TaxID=3341726 RepID=UPI0035A81FB1